ncbi:MAG: type III-A CRISPR-associated RAMP protein Csm5 [Cyanobacteria bacterium J06643_4]
MTTTRSKQPLSIDNFADIKASVRQTSALRLQSPLLHIGSQVPRLSPFEYVSTARRVYLPDAERLAKALLHRGRLTDYVQAIYSGDRLVDILENAFGEDWPEAQLEEKPLFPSHLTSARWTGSPIKDLRPIIRNGFGQIYIPGSSIKGAIRTAVAYHLLKYSDRYHVPSDTRISNIEKQLRSKLKTGELKSKFKQKFLDDSLFMQTLFERYGLCYQDKTIKVRTGPNTDIMRALQVSDSQPLSPFRGANTSGKQISYNVPITAEVFTISRYADYKAKHRASIFAEMLRNVSAQFTLSLDTEMLSWFRHEQGMKLPFQSLEELLAICEEFAQDQWDGEYDHWQTVKNNRDRGKNLDLGDVRQFYERETCPFTTRLGWGSGMTGVTIDWLLKDNVRSQLRDVCGIKAPGFEAPKTRRVALSPRDELMFLPGWVKLTPASS